MENNNKLKFIDYSWENFLNAPVGTQVFFDNGEVLLKTHTIFEHEQEHYQFVSADEPCRKYKDLENFQDKEMGKIIRIIEPVYTTVYENLDY